MILRKFISLREFTVYMENSLRFEICTEVSFTTPKVMWTLIMKLPHTEVKFYPEAKSQTGLSSLRVSCKRALNVIRNVLVYRGVYAKSFQYRKSVLFYETWVYYARVFRWYLQRTVSLYSFWFLPLADICGLCYCCDWGKPWLLVILLKILLIILS